MPGEWREMENGGFTLHWEDKDGDRLPINDTEDLKIAVQEMIRTVSTPTIFINPK